MKNGEIETLEVKKPEASNELIDEKLIKAVGRPHPELGPMGEMFHEELKKIIGVR